MEPNKEILSELTNIERKALPELLKNKSTKEIEKATNLKEIEVIRALQWLSNKQLLDLNKEEKELIFLDKNGEEYKKEGLPEKKFLKAIENEKKTMQELLKSLKKDEVNASIGLLKRQAAITSHQGPSFEITEAGKLLLQKETLEEKFLKQNFPIEENLLPPEFKKVLQDFQKRKDLIKKDKQITWSGTLTEKGKQIAKLAETNKDAFEERITPEMLKKGTWKNKEFRSFDINSNVPRIHRGKKHFVNEAIEYIRRIWLELGFEEMEGYQVQSAFWDMDALFVPQDHPAREEQDTFYIEGKAILPEKILKRVKAVHEDGGDTGSKGWQTPYSREIAQEILLRTHTTVLSGQTLSKLKKEDLPKKFFTVGKVFRNEALDWKHLFEFQQVEGIVVDPEAGLSKLKGYLKEFFKKMGFPDARIRPGYFPYTEPSAEIEVYHPVKKEWIEMGGCGIFRPELTKTLMGFECPVLAWGLGMERIITAYFEINDLRELYKNDIEQLKTIKTFMK